MSTLNQQLNDSLEEIEHYRKVKFTVAVAAVVAAIVGLLALTSLMYSSTPADVDAGRIGVQAFD